MAAKCITFALLIVLVARISEAQWGNVWNNGWNNGWNNQNRNNQNRNNQNGQFSFFGNGGIWGSFTSNQNNDQYVTCISKNSNHDEMRITFTQSQPSRNWWDRRWGGRRAIRLDSQLYVGQQSNINGMYRMVITENGRAADGCDVNSLGNVYDSFRNLNMWLTPNRQQNAETGILGNAMRLSPRNGQNWNGNLERINSLDEIVGRACILCREDGLFNGRCNSPIDLCCTMGYDSKPASQPFNQRRGVNVQGVVGITNVGSMGNGNMGGMNSGIGNMGSGGMGTMGNGMGTGLDGGLGNGGLGNGGLGNGGLGNGGLGNGGLGNGGLNTGNQGMVNPFGP